MSPSFSRVKREILSQKSKATVSKIANPRKGCTKLERNHNSSRWTALQRDARPGDKAIFSEGNILSQRETLRLWK